LENKVKKKKKKEFKNTKKPSKRVLKQNTRKKSFLKKE